MANILFCERDNILTTELIGAFEQQQHTVTFMPITELRKGGDSESDLYGLQGRVSASPCDMLITTTDHRNRIGRQRFEQVLAITGEFLTLRRYVIIATTNIHMVGYFDELLRESGISQETLEKYYRYTQEKNTIPALVNSLLATSQ